MTNIYKTFLYLFFNKNFIFNNFVLTRNHFSVNFVLNYFNAFSVPITTVDVDITLTEFAPLFVT